MATIKIELDKRSTRTDGSHPVKLVLYLDGFKKRYGTPWHFSSEEWSKMQSGSNRDERLRESKFRMEEFRLTAERVLRSLGNNASVDDFERMLSLYSRRGAPCDTDIYMLFEEYLEGLQREMRIGTRNIYRVAYLSLRRFAPSLQLDEVTPRLLKSYENWLLASGRIRSMTTVGIYMRTVRVIMNMARERGLISESAYPFGQSSRKYTIPAGRNIKKALSIAQLKRIAEYECRNPQEEFARDIWLFSFYCNGMNMADICRLRYCDIRSEFIYYVRSKTIRTRHDRQPIEVYVSAPIRYIINRYGSPPGSADRYIFGIIEPAQNCEEQYRAIKRFTRYVNYHMKRIAEALQITEPLTTYVARHSYATVLKHMGAPIEEISENLGHSSILTTRNYLASFPQEYKRERANRLVEIL